jgi:hypothetical protein
MDAWNIFLHTLERTKGSSLLMRSIDFSRMMHLSRDMTLCPLQDPLRFRARFVALEVANVLIDDTGALQLDIARALHQELTETPYLLGPQLENDALYLAHIRSTLHALIHTDAIQKLLHKFSLPLCHAGAKRLVQETLWPKPIKLLEIADVKRAVLTAWFTWLRQITGSCFATAPAILIQQEQPLQLVQDLFDLLTFGALRRIVSGHEYRVPLCPSIEQFDLIRPLFPFSPTQLSYAPGLRAAITSAGFPLPRTELENHIAEEKEAKTAKELIESILLRLFSLKRDDVADEEAVRQLGMDSLLAKHSAVYYQKPSERATKVSGWKKAVENALSAYQALGDCALLRAWEATVASFSDVKLDIGKWNLYVSLGLHPEHEGGIGALLYNGINTKIGALNQQIAQLQGEYEHLTSIAHAAEKRGLGGEYSHAMYRAGAIREQMEDCAREGERLSKLFTLIIQSYDRLIPTAFQEIFDPSLVQNLAEMIDDSPAGFRLAYKHGRTASLQWTFIRTAEEFIQALREFFEYAERELLGEFPMDRAEIEKISTDVIQYIQTEPFLTHSIQRTRTNPVLHDPRAMPWEYISGGTMPALLMTYYNRHAPFSVLKKTIRNETELLSFLVDSAPKTGKSALIHSPTHAFLFHPHWLPDNVPQSIAQMQNFWKQVKVEDEEWLVEKLATWLSPKEAPLFIHRWRQIGIQGSLPRFRQTLLELLGNGKKALIDRFLFESVPLISRENGVHRARELGVSVTFSERWTTPLEFREMVKAAFLARQGSPFSSVDLDEQIAALLRQKGWAAPKPILFADTNWSTWFFGLCVAPSGALELWRFSRTGMSGIPMDDWFRLQCNGEWVILNNPQEYSLY